MSATLVNWDILNLSGTTPAAKDRLNKISSGLDIRPSNNLIIFVGILSGPSALFNFRLEIISSISWRVEGKR